MSAWWPPGVFTGDASSAVRLSVPALASHIRTVRLVTGDIAGQQDFDVESIAELQIAIDEACARLVGLATDDSLLYCEFESTGDEFTATLLVSPVSAAPPEPDEFGWHVLTTLTDHVEQFRGHVAGSDSACAGVRLSKKDPQSAG